MCRVGVALGATGVQLSSSAVGGGGGLILGHGVGDLLLWPEVKRTAGLQYGKQPGSKQPEEAQAAKSLCQRSSRHHGVHVASSPSLALKNLLPQ